MRISDWSSDVCSSDLCGISLRAFRTSLHREKNGAARERPLSGRGCLKGVATVRLQDISASTRTGSTKSSSQIVGFSRAHRRSALQRFASDPRGDRELRSEEPTSELQSLMRMSYAVF